MHVLVRECLSSKKRGNFKFRPNGKSKNVQLKNKGTIWEENLPCKSTGTSLVIGKTPALDTDNQDTIIYYNQPTVVVFNNYVTYRYIKDSC